MKLSFLLMASFVVSGGQLQAQDRADFLDRARTLMNESPLIDGHNDLPHEGRVSYALSLDSLDLSVPQPDLMTDIPRLRSGLVGGLFWVAYSSPSFEHAGAPRVGMEQVDFIHQMVDRYDDLEFAGSADEVISAFDRGHIASLIGLEGGHMIENSLPLLRQFYALGVRYLTLTHSDNTDWADASTDTAEHGGLTPFGEEVVREMNRLGMLVDLSHVSDDTMRDALRVSEAPVIFSHSSARHFAPHPRNVPDDILVAVGEANGVVMINYVPSFIYEPAYLWEQAAGDQPRESRAAWMAANPMPLPELSVVADHIEYVRDLIGVEHVGIGSDLDGIDNNPIGLEDATTFPALIAELLARGWSDEDVKKVMGLNVIRAMRDAETVARRLQAVRGPSTARIEDLDGWDSEPEWRSPRQ